MKLVSPQIRGTNSRFGGTALSPCYK